MNAGAGPDECARRFESAHVASKSQVRTSVLSSGHEAAASANRARAGSDPVPILHDLSPMALYGALADPMIRGDVLAGMTGKDHFHDMGLSRRELADPLGRVPSPSS